MTTNQIDETLKELHAERCRLFDQHTTIGEDRFLREFIDGDFLRSKLTTLVESVSVEAEARGRLKTLQEIQMKYGLDFTEEGIKKALTTTHG